MKLVVLDRDGVINRDSRELIKSVAEWRPIPGSLEAIAKLCRAGWTVAVATNQAGIGRGLIEPAALQAIHDLMCRRVEALGGRISLLEVCPHAATEHCDCRKPKPGLFRNIAHSLHLQDLQGVPVVGDRLRDLLAGMALGCRPFLVTTGQGQETLQEVLPEGTRVFADLAAVADALIAEPPEPVRP